ncbi:MAG: SDR family NAD(P)-dependent oxidoreductase [Oscillospiraceae bacterium]|nr:SDR family NAD(P)-dependent oxidoreductase [Oscillospiraceae bacterium]
MNIAIITGASSGIGEEILRGLARERGAFGSLPFGQIWAVARNAERLEALREEIGPEMIRIFALDLTVPGAVDTLSAALAEEMPTVGLFVNCAGVGRVGPVSGQTPEDQKTMVSLNCSVPAELTSICIPYMIQAAKESGFRNGPRILNIASSAAFLPQPGFATYAASKAFLVSFSRAVNEELRPYNITSTTVCPGPVSTDFLAHATGKATASFSGIKKLFVARPEKVAASSIRAARKGRALLVYGFSQKAFHVVSKLLPARFLMFLASRLTGSGMPAPTPANPPVPGASLREPARVETTVLLPILNSEREEADAPFRSSLKKPGNLPDPTVSTSAEALAILRAYPGKTTV